MPSVSFLQSELGLGLMQASISFLLALGMAFWAKKYKITLARETVTALFRGLIQILCVGLILVMILNWHLMTGFIVLILMCGAATGIAKKRVKTLEKKTWVCFGSIFLGSMSIILIMLMTKLIVLKNAMLIPVGSMIIANSMNTCTQALERFRAEIRSHREEIEGYFALGGSARLAFANAQNAAVRASLMPRIDSLSSLGIVWIPGIMAGMVLSGTDPIYAALYQFVIMSIIYISSSVTALTSMWLAVPHVKLEKEI